MGAKPAPLGVLKYGVGYNLVVNETTGRMVIGIQCGTCKLISYHPKDVKQRYCGRCKVFHEDGPGQIA